jgi:hypothetical protein
MSIEISLAAIIAGALNSGSGVGATNISISQFISPIALVCNYKYTKITNDTFNVGIALLCHYSIWR